MASHHHADPRIADMTKKHFAAQQAATDAQLEALGRATRFARALRFRHAGAGNTRGRGEARGGLGVTQNGKILRDYRDKLKFPI